MIPDFISAHPYFSIGSISFLVNIPFGYIREGSAKFSFKWFFWIHASIPLIVYLRMTLGTSGWFIPAAIALAIAGQVLGSRIRSKNMTGGERERLEQIPDLHLSKPGHGLTNDSEIAIVLLNMGGPKTTAEVRPFLKIIFQDNLIIRFPLSFLLQGLFANLIVAFRGKAAERRYGLIGGGSPILEATQRQADELTAELKRRGHNIYTTICFNYSQPLPENTVHELKKAKKKYILPLSLYPHYSSATTGSSLFYLKKEVQKAYPEARFLNCRPYYLDDQYIAAFVERINEQLKTGESLNDFYLLFSAHGLPLYFLAEGDPYPFQISQTVAKILGRLNRKERWAISYQSAVGPLEWLKPSTDSMIKTLARHKEHKLIIVPVSFVTDHIETLCEIDIEYREFAKHLGITDFRMSRAIEAHPSFIAALADCVVSSLREKQ